MDTTFLKVKMSISMRNLLLPTIFSLAFLASISGQPWSDRVHALLEQMTLEEKVGQMTQVTVDMICQGEPYAVPVPFQVDREKLHKAVSGYGVGSILNVPSNNYPGVEQYQELITQIQLEAAGTRLKIPVLYGLDHIHGVSYIRGGTLFPQPLAQACTWNDELVRRMGVITAYESRAAGVPWSFSPAMDIGRNPEWPRLWESFGEDVLMNTIMGSAMLMGFQGDDPGGKENIAACLKHFTGYGMPLSGKDRTPAWIPERYLREYYLPQYQEAIDRGAITIMVNSGEINGIPTHADKHLLTDILRDEMGFKGLLVSDWQDIHYLYDRHHIAANLKEAVKLAVEAGIDMSMTPVSYDFADLLIELVREGTISESRIDLSVGRILYVKEALGLFEKTSDPLKDFPDFGSQAYQQVSLQAAAESVVLLKNENQRLPLAKTARVLVTGPMANSQSTLNGGWSTNWQGDATNVNLAEYNTILEGIQQVVGADNVSYVQGSDFDQLTDLDAAVSAAKESDYIILCLGEFSYCEDSGNLNELDLPDAQITLAKRMAETGKPVILSLTEGRPRIIRQVVEDMDAVLVAFHPGPQGGNAIARILFGDHNPSGRLALTYPKYSASLVPYDHKYTEDRDIWRSGKSYDPQFEFGHGLSYTTFSYSNLKIRNQEISKYGTLEVSLDIQNTGQREGMEAVGLYVSDLTASITPPVKRLRAFEKINLKPGETKNLTFNIPVQNLAFVGMDNQWVVEPGEFKLQIGNLTGMFVVK